MTQVATEESSSEARQTRSITTPLDRYIQTIAKRLGGDKAKEVERFIKFAMVGTIGFVVDFGTLNILLATLLPPVDSAGNSLTTNVALATTVAFIAAITSNFIWNRLWTYPDSRSRSIFRQMAQFATVSVIGWLARTLWITLAYQPVGNAVYPIVQSLEIPLYASLPDVDAAARLGANITQFIGVFVVMIWNFFANRYWTYNDVD